MTFPQPNSVTPLLLGEQSFRLQTAIVSAGDIYESEVSGLAFALGPDADIANVNLNYFSETSNTLVGEAQISVGCGLVGRIDARNDVAYPGGRKGRILISPADNYTETWTPAGYILADDAIQYIRPVLDVIQYFVNPPSMPEQRSDKTYTLQYFTPPLDLVNGTSYLVVPSYGRKSAFFTFKNLTALASNALIFGVRFGLSYPAGGSAPDGSTQEQLYSQALAVSARGEYTYKASVDNLWDALVVAIGPYDGGAFPTTITVSDVAL